MQRLLAFALLTLIALPVQAQLRHFDDPAVWVATSVGFFPWTSSDIGDPDQDNVATSVSVGVASPSWMVQAGAQISGLVDADLRIARILDPFSTSGSASEAPVTYRTVYAVAGPLTKTRWFMAGAAVGPSLTWGTLARKIRSECPPQEDLCFNELPFSRYETERYLNPGLAGSVQGFVRLDGRVWIGGETMLVANASSTHLATRFALRIELLRPER